MGVEYLITIFILTGLIIVWLFVLTINKINSETAQRYSSDHYDTNHRLKTYSISNRSQSIDLLTAILSIMNHLKLEVAPDGAGLIQAPTPNMCETSNSNNINLYTDKNKVVHLSAMGLSGVNSWSGPASAITCEKCKNILKNHS